MLKICKLLVLLQLVLIPFGGWAQHIIVVDSQDQEITIAIEQMGILIDSSQNLTIEKVQDLAFDHHGPQSPLQSKGELISYWVKLHLKGTVLKEKSWFLEGRDPTISYIDFYIPNADSSYNLIQTGARQPYKQRPIFHKNFIAELPAGQEEVVLFMNIKSKKHNPFLFRIKSAARLVGYFANEYVLLGVFYGIMLVMGLYNLLLYFYIKDELYLMYVFYVLSSVSICLTFDGLGFQYIWYEYPWINIYIGKTGRILWLFSFVIYANRFIEISKSRPALFRYILYSSIFAASAIATIPGGEQRLFLLILFTIPIIGIIIATLIRIKEDYELARIFGLALSFVAFSFIILFLANTGAIHWERLSTIQVILIVYAVNIALVFEVIILSIAQARRLHVFHADQADKLNMRLSEIQDKNEQLELYIRSNSELQNFAYVASHDMKQPVRSIMGFSVLLKELISREGELSHRASQFLDQIISGAENLNSFIAELLKHSQVNALDNWEYAPADLNKIIEKVRLNLSQLIGETGTMIKQAKLPEIVCEGTRMQQLFQNLITNAIKFKKQDELCQIEIFSQSKGDKWLIAVRDNGIGIDEEQQQKIFEVFVRLNSNSMFEGHGLGLATCKKIVEAHKGRIWVSSKLGHGSTFWIELPKNPEIISVDAEKRLEKDLKSVTS